MQTKKAVFCWYMTIIKIIIIKRVFCKTYTFYHPCKVDLYPCKTDGITAFFCYIAVIGNVYTNIVHSIHFRSSQS